MLISCSRSTLVGTWRSDGSSSNHQIVFLENGTGEHTNLTTGSTRSFTWADGSMIPFAFSDRFGIRFFEYELNGDTLTLVCPETWINHTFRRQ